MGFQSQPVLLTLHSLVSLGQVFHPSRIGAGIRFIFTGKQMVALLSQHYSHHMGGSPRWRSPMQATPLSSGKTQAAKQLPGDEEALLRLVGMLESLSENRTKKYYFFSTSVRKIFPLRPQPCSQVQVVLSSSANPLSKLRPGMLPWEAAFWGTSRSLCLSLLINAQLASGNQRCHSVVLRHQMTNACPSWIFTAKCNFWLMSSSCSEKADALRKDFTSSLSGLQAPSSHLTLQDWGLI